MDSFKLYWDAVCQYQGKLCHYVKYAITGVATIITPCVYVQVLQSSNVETFITFRSSTPLVMSFCDWMFLWRTLPNLRSWACLILIVGGALGYVLVDSVFMLSAYLWLIVW